MDTPEYGTPVSFLSSDLSLSSFMDNTNGQTHNKGREQSKQKRRMPTTNWMYGPCHLQSSQELLNSSKISHNIKTRVKFANRRTLTLLEVSGRSSAVDNHNNNEGNGGDDSDLNDNWDSDNGKENGYRDDDDVKNERTMAQKSKEGIALVKMLMDTAKRVNWLTTGTEGLFLHSLQNNAPLL